jgi:hypothetical protein
MTYDPDRDAKAPSEMNPNVRPSDRPGNGMGMGMWFAIFAVLAVASFFFFSSERFGSVATNDRPAVTIPNTTGSGDTDAHPAARDGAPNNTDIPSVTAPTPAPAPKQ